MQRAGCATKEIDDACEFYDEKGHTSFDQPRLRLPPTPQEDQYNHYGEEDYIDERETSTRGSSRMSGTTKASETQPNAAKGRGKTTYKGIQRRRPSVQKPEGRQASVNLYNATIHTFNAQTPQIQMIPTITL
eukprot:3864230-Amphidinium_carterae.1